MIRRFTSRHRRARVVVAAAALGAVGAALAACTGVPASSAPVAIQRVTPGYQPPAGAKPYLGEPARQIVTDFLYDNAVDPRQHTAARLYLTPTARNRWTDTTATIVQDERVGTYRPGKSQVVVSGRIVGTLNADGIYTPTNLGIGGGGPETAFVYGVTTSADGQFRIDNPHKGLLLTTDQFSQSYQRHLLYFFDLANRYLVPDLRWSALEGLPLENWLVGELANGPSPPMQNAVNSDTMPAQANTRYFNVNGSGPTRIEIPGSSQLEGTARNRLAAQVGTTLNDVIPGESFVITDNGRAVTIPEASGTEFTADTFASTQPLAPTAAVYYVRGGRIFNQNGSPMSGAVNHGGHYFTSAALTNLTPKGPLTIAAVAGGRLFVGSQYSRLVRTQLHGQLTRPSWVPGQREVWIGDGDKIYRVSVGSGSPPKAFPVQLPANNLDSGAQIVALQLSAEGTRVAVVIQTSAGVRRLFIGDIVRSGGTVRVDTLTQVSPVGVSIDDVAWSEPDSLTAIGEFNASGESRLFTLNVDGSSLTDSNINTLPPGHPDYITIAPGQLAWVSVGSSANGTVWRQRGTLNWESPDGNGQTSGIAPVYLQ